jgi:thiol-disulfide isomerase/thioredoxin
VVEIKEHKQTLFILVAIVVAITAITWYLVGKNTNAVRSDSPAAQALGDDSEDTKYTDLDGVPASLSEYLGTVIVATSWASWSPSSANALKLLNELSADYSQDEVSFLAINRAEPASRAHSYLKSININNRLILLLDEGDYYYKSIEGFSMPETVVYDSEGDILRQIRGTISEQAVRDAIAEGQSEKVE